MRFKFLKVLCVILIILLILGCGKKEPVVVKQPEQPKTVPAECSNEIGEQLDFCIDEYHMNQALETRDITKCNTITDATLKSYCKDQLIVDQAQKTSDVSACVGATDPAQCETNYYVTKALDEDNPAACDAITDTEARTECKDHFTFSKAVSGDSECNAISDEFLKEQCIFTETINKVSEADDVALCNSLGETFKQNCVDTYYNSKAYESDNVGLCDNTSVPETCRDNYYVRKAITTGNKQFCASVSEELLREICEGQ